jgi:L-fuculose-phosphate aldolase
VSAREAELRAGIVEVGRRLYARGLISGHEGNISARDGDALLITPAGVCKGFLTPETIVRADLHGRQLGGPGRVSTETRMHTAAYERRADVFAIVHAHPPTATAFAVTGLPLDRPLIAEAVVTLGPVPVIPYGTPSTEELARNVGDAICAAQALLLANHGALAVGRDLEQAWERMETLEQLARIALAVRSLGADNPLPPAEVSRLEGLRAKAGYPPPVCVPCPSCGTGVELEADGRVVLGRDELVRLVADAVSHFAGRG